MVSVSRVHRHLVSSLLVALGLLTTIAVLRLGRLVVLLIGDLRGEGKALTHSHLFLVGGGGGLLTRLLGMLELSVEVGVDAQRLHLLAVLDLGGPLSLL